ncbi:MAG: outer membrane beta-barrel protein [Bacteroidales bacterium]|nr:outer membrane beta-barrel protein [Bacteroidales bacterium]
MKKNYQIVPKALLVAFLLTFLGVVQGQNTNLDDNDKCYYQWYFNLNGGFTQSHCDLQEGEWHLDMLNKDELTWGFGARLGKHISPVFTLYGSLINAPLKGIRNARNLRFESELTDYILGTTVSFTNLVFGYSPKRRINIYGTTGIGFVDFIAKSYIIESKNMPMHDDPAQMKLYQADELYNQFGDKGDRTTEAMVPTGVGLDFKISNRWDVNVETTIRWFDSDKLDALISGNKNDAYYYTSLGLSYNFWRPKEAGQIMIETDYIVLSVNGDSVPMQIKGTIPDYFNKKAVVEFTPVLKYGSQTKKLPTIYLQGEEVPEEFRKPGAIIIPSTGGNFTYSQNIKYEPGMDVCEVYVEPMASINGKTPFSLVDRKLADGLIMTSKRVMNSEVFLTAEHGLQRDIIVSKKGIIYYVVNRHDLNFDYSLNKESKAKFALAELNTFIENGWKIRDIDVHAWASPEGEESFNQGLSQRRSETGRKYIEDKLNAFWKKYAKEHNTSMEDVMQDVKYNLTAHGEDWDGFMRAVQASEIKDKNVITNVVNSQSDVAKREQEIRNMALIYKEIEKDILPPLRRSEITVNCYEPSKSDTELAEMATTHPDSLTINELLYAATLTNDNTARLNIYKAASEIYPQDWRGFNNAGYVSMEMGNLTDAKNYFNQAKNIAATNGLVLNNLGAVASKEKNYSQAKNSYLEAQKQGVDVSYNLGILRILEGNYSGANNAFGSKKCDYNVGLAQLLSGNYSGANATFNCAEKNAQVYYMLAVVGARTNNEAQMFENLKKAVNEDAGLKEVAKTDMEFLKYFNNPDFQNAIR